MIARARYGEKKSRFRADFGSIMRGDGSTSMRIQGRSVGILILVASLTLSGCVLDPSYNFDDGTLLSGKQQWETKRHADDWIVPIGDAMAVMGLTFLVQSAASAMDDAIDRATTPGWVRQKEHSTVVAPGQCP
jgi:hypothetical protein